MVAFTVARQAAKAGQVSAARQSTSARPMAFSAPRSTFSQSVAARVSSIKVRIRVERPMVDDRDRSRPSGGGGGGGGGASRGWSRKGDTKLHLQTPTVIIHAAERRFLFTTTSPRHHHHRPFVVVGPPKKRPKRSNERTNERSIESHHPAHLHTYDSLTSLHTPPFEIPTPDLEQHSSHCLDHGQEVGRRPLQG